MLPTTSTFRVGKEEMLGSTKSHSLKQKLPVVTLSRCSAGIYIGWAINSTCSRLVCLRVHPMFTLLHPKEVFVTFVSINGSKYEVWPEFGEQLFEGDLWPSGDWMLVDKCLV